MEPQVVDLVELLIRHNSILVHFSGSRADLPEERQYPGNLQFAVANPRENSFSSVRPEHDGQKHWGTFGIIGLPVNQSGLTGIGPNDWGTWRPDGRPDGVIEVPEKNGNRKTCDLILGNNMHPYDEWVLNSYAVAGLFLFSDEHLTYRWPPTPEAFSKILPGLRVFTAINGTFYQIEDDGSLKESSVGEIYCKMSCELSS